jgi:SsrA-binding protein
MGEKVDIHIANRKASFEYIFVDNYVAGIALAGTEIKSIRQNGASINDAFCYVNNGEVFIKNMHISQLKNVKYDQHDPTRERKLLLTKKEIKKITESIQKDGYTVVAKNLFTNSKGIAKLDIAVAKGKKLYDKRESIKKKDIERDLKREGI